VSPFFIGMIADRFFSAEKVMGVMHLASAVFLYLASQTTDVWTFTALILAHSLCYMPTLALVNSISFNQMKDPGKEFPLIRVFGTFGWIVSGFTITFILVYFTGKDETGAAIPAALTNIPLQLAAIMSVVLGVYSFFLPKTPPAGKGKEVKLGDIIGIQALGLLKDRSFATFAASSLLLCIPLAFYYAWTNPFLYDTGMANATFKQSFGQWSELLFMLIMPFCFIRFGVKKMLAIGMAAWVLRYGLFAFGDNQTAVWMLYSGILLHGICYDFFFVTGQIYVNKTASPEIRSNAQGFITLLTYGVGMTIGSIISGRVVESYTSINEFGQRTFQWQEIWLFPGIMALVVLIVFCVLFKDKPEDRGTWSCCGSSKK
jgi:nucleoside transporter